MAINQTRENILKKRRLNQKQKRLRFFRFLFTIVLISLVGSAILFVGYAAYSGVSYLYREYQTMYQEYTERKESRQMDAQASFEGYTNVLILGLDDGADAADYGGQNADTILLMSFANDTGRTRFITIPRDTWVTMPDGQGTRLGTLYNVGGASMMVREISSLLGVSIHQYITLDMATFSELIDIMEGIDLYVESDMDYEDPVSGLSIHLKQGYQHMDGQTAQEYLRYRDPELGDVGRVQRQQKFLKALYDKLLQLGTVPKLPAIADMFQHRMKTSAEIFDSAHLANVLRRLSSEAPQTIMLPGNYAANDDSIWVPDQAAIQERIKELFPESEILGSEQQ